MVQAHSLQEPDQKVSSADPWSLAESKYPKIAHRGISNSAEFVG